MPDRDSIHALPVPEETDLDPDLRKYFSICREKLGLVPNVLRSFSFRPERLRRFIDSYNEIMLSDGALTKLERELIAVTVSSCNRCFYCLVAHGQQVRALSGDPELGDTIALNYRAADLDERTMVMLDFVWALTESPNDVDGEDRALLYEVGFDHDAVWEIVETAAFFNYTNRLAHGLEMMPNRDYHHLDRKGADD